MLHRWDERARDSQRARRHPAESPSNDEGSGRTSRRSTAHSSSNPGGSAPGSAWLRSAGRSRYSCMVCPKYLPVSPTHSMPLRRIVSTARVLLGRTTAKISSMSCRKAHCANAYVVSVAYPCRQASGCSCHPISRSSPPGGQGQQRGSTEHSGVGTSLNAPPPGGRSRPKVLDDPLPQEHLHRFEARNLVHDRTQPADDLGVPEGLEGRGRVLHLPAPKDQTLGDQALCHASSLEMHQRVGCDCARRGGVIAKPQERRTWARLYDFAPDPPCDVPGTRPARVASCVHWHRPRSRPPTDNRCWSPSLATVTRGGGGRCSSMRRRPLRRGPAARRDQR